MYKTSCIDVSYVVIDVENDLDIYKLKDQKNSYEMRDIESGIINTYEKQSLLSWFLQNLNIYSK